MYVMPIYEYVCTSCGHNLEIFQGINDSPLVKCEQCQKSSLMKLVSASQFRLKGGGWYETDFKKDKDKKKNLAGNDGISSEISKPEMATKVDSTSTVSKTQTTE